MSAPGAPSYAIQSALQQQSAHSRSYSHLGSDGVGSHHDNWSGDDSGDGDGEDKDGSRKRKRPMSVSCELCKQRKVKCDRGQPSCGWCLRNSQACEYRERKKPGLRAGYGRELESRLDRLESIVSSQQNVIAQLLNNGGSPARQTSIHSPAKPAPEANMFANASALPQATPNTASADPQTSYSPQTPVVTGMRGGYVEYSSPYQDSPHGSYQKHDPALLQQDNQPYYSNGNAPIPTPTSNIQGESSSNFTSQDHDLPPYDLLYSLADLYFKHVNTWCPILHRRSTFDALFGPSSLDEADRILLHAIVATTLRFSTDARLTPETKAKYHTVSKQNVLLYGLENSSVKALQALVILALDLCGSSNGPPGWNVLALIARSAVQLGLSVEATSPAVSPRIPSIYTLRAMVLPEPDNWIEDEGRRRLFWMIYILDRYATLTTAFDFALNEKEIDRKLPCRDDQMTRNQPVETRWFRRDERAEKGVDKPENMGSFSYYVEVVGILSRIHEFLKEPVDIGALADVERWQREYKKLDSTLNAWKDSLPKEYGNTNRLFDSSAGNKIVNCGWVMLHATYHTTVMRLHSSAAYPARRSPIFTPSFRASQCCLTAVESISALCAHVKSNGMLSKLGPPFAFSVWVASRLLLVHSSTIDHQINPTVQFLVTTLRELGAYWNVADRYAKLLQRVLDEFADSEREAASAPPGAERSTPSSVRILADMRRCAFDLDFLISRQPRQNSQHALTMYKYQTAPSSATPARTPSKVELDYLDVFDFFNMPRVPMSVEGAGVGGSENALENIQTFGLRDQAGSNGFNFANSIWDANTDWFMKSP